MVLTRAMLEDGGLLRMVAETSPDLPVLSAEERAASLAATLRKRPAGDGVWLFAYGSLIWNPAIAFAERRFARINGWHRAFCLSTVAGRGTPDAPGLVLGLDRGGACTGAAFRVAEADIETELALLWQREMLSGSYAPRWVPAGPSPAPSPSPSGATARTTLPACRATNWSGACPPLPARWAAAPTIFFRPATACAPWVSATGGWKGWRGMLRPVPGRAEATGESLEGRSR
jgi:hypothetical protein